jgi:hypothetical protein
MANCEDQVKQLDKTDLNQRVQRFVLPSDLNLLTGTELRWMNEVLERNLVQSAIDLIMFQTEGESLWAQFRGSGQHGNLNMCSSAASSFHLLQELTSFDHAR